MRIAFHLPFVLQIVVVVQIVPHIVMHRHVRLEIQRRGGVEDSAAQSAHQAVQRKGLLALGVAAADLGERVDDDDDDDRTEDLVGQDEVKVHEDHVDIELGIIARYHLFLVEVTWKSTYLTID